MMKKAAIGVIGKILCDKIKNTPSGGYVWKTWMVGFVIIIMVKNSFFILPVFPHGNSGLWKDYGPLFELNSLIIRINWGVQLANIIKKCI